MKVQVFTRKTNTLHGKPDNPLSKVYKIYGTMTIIVIKVKTLLAPSLPFGTWLLLVAMRGAISSCDDNFSRLRKYAESELYGKQRRRRKRTDDIFILGPSTGSPSNKAGLRRLDNNNNNTDKAVISK